MDAEVALRGEDGWGRWRTLLGQLVGRRNGLAAELAAAYMLGPSHPPPLLDATALERHIDNCWMAGGAGADEDDGGALRRSLPAAASPASFGSGKLTEAFPSTALGRNGDAAAGRGAAGMPPARLSVAGLEIPANLVRRILHGEDGLGGPGSPDEEQRVAAALGYVAHIVERLAAYLDIPLRYPPIHPPLCAGAIDAGPASLSPTQSPQAPTQG
jgi:hypothetical protein